MDVPQFTADMLRLKKSMQEGHIDQGEKGGSSVKLFMEDGSAYTREGTLQFAETTVDPSTGSVILRAVFPNPDGLLLPGMFVRAQIREGINNDVILVPQQGVGRDHRGNPYALIVDAENKVGMRPLTLNRAIGSRWLVGSGLAPGDRVIVEGLQMLRPGTVVKPEPFTEKKSNDGSVVHISDIGRVELGAERYGSDSTYNGNPTAGLAIRQAAGANALDTADAVKSKIEELSQYFPPGMKVIYPYDTTPFTKVAIDEVVKSLIEAVFLVFIIMYLFMGTFRATLIPTIAVPVVLLATFAILGIFGFTINMLTRYEKAIQSAFREVADALAVQDSIDQQVAAQTSLVEAAAEAWRLSEKRYEMGIGDYLSVLDAHRTLYAQQQVLVSLRLAKRTNQVAIYSALGGGEDNTGRK